jgi:DNA helicase-2/ATP-dependent DNA helicase PcrA
MNAGSEESVAEERRLFYVALTRARRRLHVYVPFRYYHRPRGRDDGHGYGKASRFLTDEVQRLFAVTHGAAAHPPPATSAEPARRVEVSVNALFD